MKPSKVACPHCGKKDKLYVEYDEYDDSYSVGCERCRIWGPDKEGTEQEAIKAWNPWAKAMHKQGEKDGNE